MISFLYQNKGKTRICEDSLTSTTFDLLRYLPTELFWRILGNSLLQNKLPRIPGEILEFSYWAKWNAKETGNSNFVEPDIFIRFEEFDVIIEAKRYNENQQVDGQISNEINAYFNEYAEDKKDLYFIQLGGLRSFLDEEHEKVVLCKTDWTRLLDQIVYERKQMETVDLAYINAQKRILDDLIKGFELHNFFKKLWLESLNKTIIANSCTDELFNYASKKKLWIRSLEKIIISNKTPNILFSYAGN